MTAPVFENGFSRHGLLHTSASQINQYAEAPHMWLAQYLFNRRSSFGAAAKAGMLVEDAVVNIVARGFTEENAIGSALSEYNKFTALGATDTDNKRGLAIPGMISGAVEVLKQYGEPEFDITGKQKKIEVLCNGDNWSLPIVGYLDLHYPKHGLIFDLKTTMKMPSEMSDSHKRQSCIYRRAMSNQIVKFLYTTGKKTEVVECEDVNEVLADIKSILNRQERFLRLGDKELLRSVVPLMTSSYYNDAAITKELFSN